MESEIFRTVEGFREGEVTCPRCGTSFHMFFNGGELDEAECCGINFRTEATGYRLVMSPTGGDFGTALAEEKARWSGLLDRLA